jgi:type II secretory pathway component GspD/PulD (secretin)
VQVVSRVFEVPDELLPGLGLDQLRTADQATAGNGLMSAEDALGFIKKLQNLDGVDLLNAPEVTTLNGRQAQISVTESHSLPSGQTYTTGPIIDVVPTIGADKQTVELVVGVQLNLGRASAPQ